MLGNNKIMYVIVHLVLLTVKYETRYGMKTKTVMQVLNGLHESVTELYRDSRETLTLSLAVWYKVCS